MRRDMCLIAAGSFGAGFARAMFEGELIAMAFFGIISLLLLVVSMPADMEERP